MTLAGAVRDDLAALEAGVYRILPHRDLSGRQLVLLEPRRNTGQGYSAESLVSVVAVRMVEVNILASFSDQSSKTSVSSFVRCGTSWNVLLKNARTFEVATSTLAIARTLQCGTLVPMSFLGCRTLRQSAGQSGSLLPICAVLQVPYLESYLQL